MTTSLNAQEVYLLNERIYGDNLFMIPPPRFSAPRREQARWSLEYKGVALDSPQEDGQTSRLLRMLTLYKRAAKYVKIDTVVIAVLSKESGISMQKDIQSGEYTFRLVRIPSAEELLRMIPEDVDDSGEGARGIVVDISDEEVFLVGGREITGCLYLSTYEVASCQLTNEVFFSFHDRIYGYNRDSKSLMMTGRRNALSVLEARIR